MSLVLESASDVGGFPSAIRASAGEQLDPGSRAAVLRRSERTRLSSASDDEVGGFPSAIRASASEQLDTVPPMGFEPMLERV
jgi:hypothetical protein